MGVPKKKRAVMSLDLRDNDRLMVDKLATMLNTPKAVVMRMALKAMYDRYFDERGQQRVARK